jgi:hypothetical protein
MNLSGNQSGPRKAQPGRRRCREVCPELDRAKLQYFQFWFNRADHVTGGSARRAVVSLRTFGASDEAQPPAVAFELRRHALGEALAILGLVEDVKATTIEHQVVWATGSPVA